RARGGSHSRLSGREHGGLYGSTDNQRSLWWSCRARRVSRAGCLDPPRWPLAKARKPTDPDTQVNESEFIFRLQSPLSTDFARVVALAIVNLAHQSAAQHLSGPTFFSTNFWPTFPLAGISKQERRAAEIVTTK